MIRPLFVFLMVLVAWPTLAAAKPTRVVVGQIQGDDDADVTAAITDSIGSDVTIVGKREVSKAEDKLRLSPELTDKEIRKLLKELDADAVVKGTLEKTGDAMALHLKVYLRLSTKPKAFTLSFGNAKSDKFRATLRKTILGKLGVIEGPDGSGGSGEGEEPVKPKKPKKPPVENPDEGEAPVKPKRPRKPKKAPVEEGAEPTEGSGEEEEEEEVVVKPPSGHTANRDAVRVDAGMSVTARQLAFASRNFPQAPKPYSNGAVPGARVEGELYPLAFAFPKSPASGLGFAFDYDQTLSLTLKSQLNDGSGMVVSAKAQQQRYSFGGRFRLVFGSRATSPSLTLGVSYGVRSFVVTRAGLTDPNQIDIPDIQYKAIQPGFGLRVPFIPAVALTLDARAILVQDAGPIQQQDQYGQAKVTGGQLQAGIDIVIANRFAIRLVGEYAQFGFAFVGNGTMTVNRDGDATSKDIGGASDRYFGGAATLAGLF